MAKSTEKDTSKLSFEDAIKKLNEIVGRIEGGDVALSASIEQYEHGMELIKHCREILQTAEKKIEKIAQQKDKE